jgi:quercetin dioxygenase-like cupin family protein
MNDAHESSRSTPAVSTGMQTSTGGVGSHFENVHAVCRKGPWTTRGDTSYTGPESMTGFNKHMTSKRFGRALAAALSLCCAAWALAQTEAGLKITRNGAQGAVRAPSDNFTGVARIDLSFKGEAPARISGGQVSFEPGARTAWHTHPLGQTLIVTSGVGLVQRWGGPVQEIRPGDIVWIPPGEKHWHGASPANAMSHLAITEQLDGKTVEWLEKVTDAQYPK